MSKICVVLNRVFIFNSNLKLVFPDRFVFQYMVQWNLVYLGVLEFLQKIVFEGLKFRNPVIFGIFPAFYGSWKGHIGFNFFMKLLCEIFSIFTRNWAWNSHHCGQTIHSTENFISMNLLITVCVVTWRWLFLTSMFRPKTL